MSTFALSDEHEALREAVRVSSELAVMMCRAADYRPPLVVFPEAPTGVHTRVSNNDRMIQFYRPKIGLDEGVHRALRVYERA